MVSNAKHHPDDDFYLPHFGPPHDPYRIALPLPNDVKSIRLHGVTPNSEIVYGLYEATSGMTKLIYWDESHQVTVATSDDGLRIYASALLFVNDWGNAVTTLVDEESGQNFAAFFEAATGQFLDLNDYVSIGTQH